MFRTVRTIALVTLWLVPLLTLVLALHSDWPSTWRALHVPSMPLSFADLRGLTSSLTAIQNGADPLVANPYDPWHRTLNYPRIWIKLFSTFRIHSGNVWMVGILFCSLYLMCISHLIVQAARPLDALIILGLGLSLAPLLAIERGNNDIAVFSLVFLGCIVQNRFARSGLFAAAALLKLFPIAGLIVESIRGPKKQILAPALAAFLTIILLTLQLQDLNLIRKATPIARFLSYGVLSWRAGVNDQLAALKLPVIFGNAVVVVCWLCGISAITRGWNNRTGLETSDLDSQSAEMFCVFGGIYAFTFATGSNWDYRLIFLLPTLPFALEMLRLHRLKGWAAPYIVSMAVAENALGFQDHGGIVFLHVATLFMFAVILMVLGYQFKLFLSSGTSEPATYSPLHPGSLAVDEKA
jgi:hypothetical protein